VQLVVLGEPLRVDRVRERLPPPVDLDLLGDRGAGSATIAPTAAATKYRVIFFIVSPVFLVAQDEVRR
jgi:hypothetical protein